MFDQLPIETAAIARGTERTERTERIERIERTDRTRTRPMRRPRSLVAAAILIALLALTAGGPLVVVSTSPTSDPAGIRALR